MTFFRPLRIAHLVTFSCLAACGGDTNGRPDAGHSPVGDGDGDAPQGDGDAPQGDGDDDPADSGIDDGEPDAASDDASAGDGDAEQPDGGTQEPARWYDSRQPLALSLSGTFGDAFEAAFAGIPDGIIPPHRAKDPFFGGIAYVNDDESQRAAEVELAVRGNSSLQECEFPKIKFSFSERNKTAGDVFFGTKKVKIGTHCGEEETVNGTIGRLRNEKATWREEVVYQLARALGITIMQTRPALVTYTDQSDPARFTSPLTRKAFLLEHIDELARRLGATALEDPVNCGENLTTLPDANAVLRVKFFHAMIGNWDWTLGPPETHGCGDIMNTEVLTYPDGTIVLVPTDFDLAAFVVGEIRNPDTNQMEAIELASATAAARAALATSLAGESPSGVASMKVALLEKQTELKAIIDASSIDTDGKADAKQLLDGFFAVLAEDSPK